MSFPGEKISSLASEPLFSTIITFYILVLLYFRSRFHGVIFSPVLISTAILLLSLLRLGAIQRFTQERNFTVSEFNSNVQPSLSDNHLLPIHDHKRASSESSETSEIQPDYIPATANEIPFYAESFVEWDVRAPLEVIYEDHEGEGDEGEEDIEKQREAQMAIIERYSSLSKVYPETDSDTSEAWSEEDFEALRDRDSPEDSCFQWEGEDIEGLIEIELGQKGHSEVEDDLIEIDLSPAR